MPPPMSRNANCCTSLRNCWLASKEPDASSSFNCSGDFPWLMLAPFAFSIWAKLMKRNMMIANAMTSIKNMVQNVLFGLNE